MTELSAIGNSVSPKARVDGDLGGSKRLRCNRLHLCGDKLHNESREQVREAAARHRKRRKRGCFWRPVMVTKSQLDQLQVRGYLNPDLRGNRLDECDAIEAYLIDALAKPG
jgi:hypothetical protein